jgi:hypothetical protein
MRTPGQVLDAVRTRLANTWAATLGAETTPTSAAEASGDASPRWPHAFPLGKVTAADAERDFSGMVRAVAGWRDWAAARNLDLRWESRRLLGTPQRIPTHLVVATVDVAAELAGDGWVERLARGRSRADLLVRRYPQLARLAGMIGDLDAFTDLDVDLLCRAADWFTTHNARGMTPRQVPIEGLHAKWLNTRRSLVAELAGVPDLGVLPSHPPRIHFTYLDPGYRASGRRRHDSSTVGDRAAPEYLPRIVVISENKDTALYFPKLGGAISVEGGGRGAGTAASFGWITGAKHVFYWGDMDADGLEILNEFRSAGIWAVSLLMDVDAYQTWERYGTNSDPKGRLLTARPARPLPHLTDGEAALYQSLVDPAWTRFRRIEQERIPLAAALDALLSQLGGVTTTHLREPTEGLLRHVTPFG